MKHCIVAIAAAGMAAFAGVNASAQSTDISPGAPPAASDTPGTAAPVTEPRSGAPNGAPAARPGVDGSVGPGVGGATPGAPGSYSAGGDGTVRPGFAQPRWYSAQQGEIRGSRLINVVVRNDAGENIGHVNEIVISRDGRVAAVVIGVGGFLGLGERNVAVAFETIRLTVNSSNEPIMVLSTNRTSLASAPEWKWSAADESGVTGSGTGAAVVPRGGAASGSAGQR